MSKKVINAALLGLGTVGTGVYKVLKNQEAEMEKKIGATVKLKKILVRNLKKAAAKIAEPEILTNNWKEILEDESIDIVIEVMGGIEPAKTYIMEALKAGKNVVTANKDLVASHGGELLDCAAANQCDFLFEAAVAGGIPIIRPLKHLHLRQSWDMRRQILLRIYRAMMQEEKWRLWHPLPLIPE